MNLDTLKFLINDDYILEANKEKERLRSQSQNSQNSQISEKFRFDNNNSTTTKVRPSLDSSILLSNISLNEVFESDKKLLNKTSSLLNNFNLDNIILEEDSNFNLNTFDHNMRGGANAG